MHRGSRASRIAHTARIHRAFVASTELRPMAQQLALLRTPAAYAGVTAYAQKHTGEAAAAAYLALGHAYLLDKRYAEASSSLALARKSGQELADYADYLGAQASHAAGNDAAAETLLKGFTDRYPDSIFVDREPELEANILLSLNNPAAARAVLVKAQDTGAADRVAYQLAVAQVALALGEKSAAIDLFKKVLLAYPLSPEAQIARARLTEAGAESTLTVADLRSLGDAYYNAGRYGEAVEQYRALERSTELSAADRNGFAVAEAACELKLKHLTTAQAEALEDSNDENGARRLDLLMELARDRDDEAGQQSIVSEMETRFPRSPWLEEALFSSGNMYLLKRDYPRAVEYYSYLATHFPDSKNAPAAHWRAGWLSYRQGQYAEAARIFDEQIKLYPSAPETVSALYWRGRLYESEDHDPARAAANYRAIVRAYQHYFYAQLARDRLAALGKLTAATEPQLEKFQPLPEPHLVDTFPADSPHLAKARLLANAGLNEYIADEIKADPDSTSWSALAEAQIYSSYGENFRALRALKKALPYASTASIDSIPLAYWHILYPEPYWDTIKAESAKNNLDPYLVASLIRQESEFDPSVISYANAYGLMQLIPVVGRAMAREEGLTHFQTFQLLDPETNIRLGTRYLRQMLDHFGGVEEYALAAYNAGDYRVADWQAAGPYHGIDEFVESIPFTQTREYVEAIRRNQETYMAIDDFARTHTSDGMRAAR
ncbi:MAG TPA: transglycosylase SLT domain-containing protein [Terracidiphilus sp.]|nr:transglycosylase SLT domain-containing protein [Terracidiphilus sp.]